MFPIFSGPTSRILPKVKDRNQVKDWNQYFSLLFLQIAEFAAVETLVQPDGNSPEPASNCCSNTGKIVSIDIGTAGLSSDSSAELTAAGCWHVCSEFIAL